MTTAGSEFSRPVLVSGLDGRDRTIDIAANAQERAALANRLGLLNIPSLSARLVLTLTDRGVVALHGTLRADVVQACVRTLEPVPAHIEASFERLFAEAERIEEEELDQQIAVDDEEPPAPIVDETIDFGEVVTEQFALELDPYPKAAGSDFKSFALETPLQTGADDDAGADTNGPFSALARLKRAD
jgi:uncharacterized metal-binding protein YceD (DUF177 family)